MLMCSILPANRGRGYSRSETLHVHNDCKPIDMQGRSVQPMRGAIILIQAWLVCNSPRSIYIACRNLGGSCGPKKVGVTLAIPRTDVYGYAVSGYSIHTHPVHAIMEVQEETQLKQPAARRPGAVGRPRKSLDEVKRVSVGFKSKLKPQWDRLKARGGFKSDTEFISHLLQIEESRQSSLEPEVDCEKSV